VVGLFSKLFILNNLLGMDLRSSQQNIDSKVVTGAILRHKELDADGKQPRISVVKHRFEEAARTGLACAF